ncbi:MAG: 6-phosphogluconolactonase [Deltaproteobacteria bacterium]|nr:MAG: 6-phosphogluconolactonase [Deltaproteobacteria bacterium]
MSDKPEVIIETDDIQLAKRGAEIFCRQALDRVKKSGQFSVAVSGGSTPRAMHRMLSQRPYLDTIPWQQINVFWVDERMVPVDHPASNFGAARSDWLEKVPIPAGQIHPMPGQVQPEKGASQYQKELAFFFKDQKGDYPVFDLIFLGIGTDGHTASLFPDAQASLTTEKWVISVKVGNPDVHRITLTYPVLNHVRCICFMVSGNKKAPILKTVFENPKANLPAQKIKPLRGKLLWLLDEAAASLLPEKLFPVADHAL